MRVALMLAVLVAGYWTAVFFLLPTALFPAPNAVPTLPNPGGTETIGLPQPAGIVSALFLPPTTAVVGRAPLLIFTHGNAELAQAWVADFATPRAWGWAALLVEYPGYGGEPGRPSERSINAVVTAAYDWARRDARIDASRIVAYGRSLGGGPAVRLATARPIAGLILESSFTGVARLAARYLVPSFVIRDRFDNLAALRDYRGPLLVLHGGLDEIVPVTEGKALAAAVPGAQFVQMACGHNDCPRAWAVVKAFLGTHGLMPPSGNGGGLPSNPCQPSARQEADLLRPV
jgi:hypothetical protein